jgi:hypothetical protein
MIQQTTADQPSVSSVNGENSALFDDANTEYMQNHTYYLPFMANNNAEDYTMFVVTKYDDSTNQGYPLFMYYYPVGGSYSGHNIRNLNDVALTGTVSVTAGTAAVTGVGTSFLSQAPSGRYIIINGETHQVLSVTDNLNLTLVTNHVAGASGVVATRIEGPTVQAGDRISNTVRTFRVGDESPDTTQHIWELNWNGTSWELYWDDGTLKSGVTAGGSWYSRLQSGYQLGRNAYSPGSYFSGHVCEVLVYDRVLSSLERSSVRNYLRNKWGVV